MPAAAVIPAPIAYIKVVAVKNSVVEFQGPFSVPGHCVFFLFVCAPFFALSSFEREGGREGVRKYGQCVFRKEDAFSLKASLSGAGPLLRR